MTHGAPGTFARSSGFSGPQMNVTSPSGVHSADTGEAWGLAGACAPADSALMAIKIIAMEPVRRAKQFPVGHGHDVPSTGRSIPHFGRAAMFFSERCRMLQ